jgi:hypothetical protein
MTIFKFLCIVYVQYNFYTQMSRVINSHFAKYCYDIYSEYITPCTVMCTVMTYAASDAIRVTPLWLRTLRLWAMI